MFILKGFLVISTIWMILCVIGWTEFVFTNRFCLYYYYGKLGIPPFANFADEDNTGCYCSNK